MYKKTVEYTDYNGEKVTEDLYFNLTKSELLDMHFHSKGGLKNYLETIINAHDTAVLIDVFKELLVKAYGVRDPEGRKFIKNDKVREDFICSIPYDILFSTLSTDSKEAAAFINGIIPKELAEEMEKIEKEAELSIK